MKHSDKLDLLFKALTTFRKQVKQPVKSADNPFFKSKYVDIDGVVKAIDDGCKETGLSFVQETVSEPGDKGVSVTTIITHESGQFIELGSLSLPADKQNPQGFGSALTYAKRYSLSAAFGITSDIDDDANMASGNVKKQQNTYNQPKASNRVSQEQADKLNVLAKKYCELNNQKTNEAYLEIKAEAIKQAGAVNEKTATSSQMNRAIAWLSETVTGLMNQQKQSGDPMLFNKAMSFDQDGNPI